MATFSTVEDKHHDKLSTFKSIDALVADRTLCCGRDVRPVKTKWWSWSLAIVFKENGVLRKQNQLLGMEKTADGKNNPAGYLNSIFRDKDLDWPCHSLRFENVGRKHIVKQYPDEKCPCAGMSEAEINTEVEEAEAFSPDLPQDEEEVPF